MKAELKRIHSPDADLDVYYPEDPENFSLFLQLMIGPEGEDSEESFDILICTPKWILDNKRLEGGCIRKTYDDCLLNMTFR